MYSPREAFERGYVDALIPMGDQAATLLLQSSLRIVSHALQTPCEARMKVKQMQRAGLANLIDTASIDGTPCSLILLFGYFIFTFVVFHYHHGTL